MFESVGVLESVLAMLGEAPIADDDSARIEQIRLLEQLRSATAALQARVTAAFVESQREQQRARGVPADLVGRGIAGQVGLARRISPYQAKVYVGWAMIAGRELPETFAALQAGHTSEWRARIVARETVFLSREQRAAVDRDMALRLADWGDRAVETEVKKRAYRLDPRGYVARTGQAHADRRVTVRPAPDVMCRVSALLPAAQGVAVYAALLRHADTLIGTGDPARRGRGQIMADTLVERVTGQTTAGDVPVEVNILITDTALSGSRTRDTIDTGDTADPADAVDTADTADMADTADSAGAVDEVDTGDEVDGVDEPAQLLDYGPIPAELVRQWLRGAHPGTPMWLRRVYRDRRTGQLVSMDSRRRCFTPAQRQFIRLRDQTCRTPWCEAAIRHIDHVTPHQAHGPTSIPNGQGLCQTCNYGKEAPGWRTGPGPRPGQITITTPTGHTYHHQPPDPPGSATRRDGEPSAGSTGAA